MLPAGKIRDVTFIFQSSQRHMCLMSSEGLIYTQQLDESSSAKSGPFYLTNIIPVVHEELKDNNGQVAGGGVSVYYSHGLQMLFFSYVQGMFLNFWISLCSRICIYPPYTDENEQVVTRLLASCNRLVINKSKSGCVHMACDSLLMTSLLQVVNRLVAN